MWIRERFYSPVFFLHEGQTVFAITPRAQQSIKINIYLFLTKSNLRHVILVRFSDGQSWTEILQSVSSAVMLHRCAFVHHVPIVYNKIIIKTKKEKNTIIKIDTIDSKAVGRKKKKKNVHLGILISYFPFGPFFVFVFLASPRRTREDIVRV